MNAFFDLTNGLMLLFNLAALLIGILHFRRSIFHKILCLYFAFSLFLGWIPSFPVDAIDDPIYSNNNILYIILFTSLMIALRCKPSSTHE